jgi:5'(3')-deoxyribonucleotidase
MKSVIAFDIDGVLADTYNAINKVIKEKYNYDTNGKVRTHQIEVPGVEYKDILKIVYNVLGDIDSISPYEEAKEYLPKIYELYGYVTFITARNIQFYNTTKKWLKLHFPMIKKFNLVFERSSNKHHVVREKEVCFMVDDRIKVVNSLPSHVTGFLVNRQWNQDREINPNVVRVNSLKEIYSTLRR